MHEAVAFVLKETVSKLIEKVVDRAFERTPEVAVDPVEAAMGVMDEFLSALRDADSEMVPLLCEPSWAEQPATADLMDHTFACAPPASWQFRECYSPAEWTPGIELPWLVAELAVTFDLGDGSYATQLAVLRAINGAYGWRIDHLVWDEPATAAEADASDVNPFSVFGDLFTNSGVQWPEPANVVIVCAGCGQRLRVPADAGRLRVTCPKCSNAQWFQP